MNGGPPRRKVKLEPCQQKRPKPPQISPHRPTHRCANSPGSSRHTASRSVWWSQLLFGLKSTNFLDYYKSTSSWLTFVASLVAYLCVAGVFGARQHIGQIVFPARRTLTAKKDLARKIYSTVVPAVCGISAVIFLILYTLTLSYSVDDVALKTSYLSDQRRTSVHEDLVSQARAATQRRGKQGSEGRSEGRLFGKPGEDFRIVGRSDNRFDDYGDLTSENVTRLPKLAYDTILTETAPDQISYQFLLFAFYVLAFATASVSLVWFGVVEYLQAELGITDADLIRRPYRVQ